VNILWAKQAQRDRRAIFDHIDAANPAAALDLDRKIRDAASLLSNNPQLGRIGNVPDTRELVIHRRYLLVYRATASTIYVLRVLHTARRPPHP
jgi:toxin ParE1/3/4